MQLREFGKLRKKVPALGFGTMRLAHQEGDSSKIREKEMMEIIRHAIQEGVNYLDTAWPYHQEACEPFLGRVLRDGYRDKVTLATKMPTWLIEKKEQMDGYFNQQLKKLETEFLDIYLLHSLNQEKWKKIKQLDVLTWLEKKKKAGYIGEFGFSFHGSWPAFQEIMESYPWPICQIQYNYVDREYQAGEKGLHYAAQKGTAVIVMEPLRGGSLAELPKDLLDILNQGETKRTAADWALQWLWNQEEVSIVLSGMNSRKQLEENIESARNSRIGSLSKKDLVRFQEVSRIFQERSPTNCTGCSYCQPCPEGLFIHHIMMLYNEAHIYQNYSKKKKDFQSFGKSVHSSSCTACGTCVEKCPQELPIPQLVKEITQYFAGESGEKRQ